MNNKFKVIQVKGFSGLFLLIFLIGGLFCGFVLFPIWILMNGWNFIVDYTSQGPKIDLLQASLLWSILALTIYLTFKNSICINVQKHDNIKTEDIKTFIKAQKTKEKVIEESPKTEEK